VKSSSFSTNRSHVFFFPSPSLFLSRSIITTINNFSLQHSITIETAPNAAEERRSRLNKSLHYLAEQDDQIFE
jgi:hypothetical protein